VLGEAIFRALAEADQRAFFGRYQPNERVTVDGAFNFDLVAALLRSRVLTLLRGG
jgi:hypothetical protein